MAFVDRKTGGNGGSGSGNRETEGGGATLLATGGEDGVLRVWELLADGQSECG